jgi:hypothetical protein
MWSKLKSGLVVISKGDNIKADNVVVAEAENHYIVLGLDKIPHRQCTWSDENPLTELMRHVNNEKLPTWMVIDGQVVNDRACILCNNKFKGFTGTCSLGIYRGYDEPCYPDIVVDKSVLATDGVKIQSRYLDEGYYRYRRGAGLSNFKFNVNVIEGNCEKIIREHLPDEDGNTPQVGNKETTMLTYLDSQGEYRNKPCRIVLMLLDKKVVIRHNEELKVRSLSAVHHIVGLTNLYSGGNKLYDLYTHLLKYIDLDTFEVKGMGKLVSVTVSRNYSSPYLQVVVENPELRYTSIIKSKKQIDTICGLAKGLTSRGSRDTL